MSVSLNLQPLGPDNVATRLAPLACAGGALDLPAVIWRIFDALYLRNNTWILGQENDLQNDFHHKYNESNFESFMIDNTDNWHF
jgi:hypothetical protein